MRIGKEKVVRLDYIVYDADTEEVLENTDELGPFFYIHGLGQFVPAVEEALDGREKGFHTSVFLSIEDGYGEYDKDNIIEFSRDEFNEFDDIYEGMDFVADMDDGTEQLFVITEINDDKVIADGNHPFAGKNLKFDVTVAEVREATAEELEHGHVHFHGFDDDCE